MTTNSGVRICDKVQISQWRDERAAQDAAAYLADPEASAAADLLDASAADPESLRELRGGMAAVTYVALAGALVIIGAIAGVIVVAQLLGPSW